jgi:hypothetical protein
MFNFIIKLEIVYDDKSLKDINFFINIIMYKVVLLCHACTKGKEEENLPILDLSTRWG